MQTGQGIALKIENLSKSYGQIKAVNGLDLKIEKNPKASGQQILMSLFLYIG